MLLLEGCVAAPPKQEVENACFGEPIYWKQGSRSSRMQWKRCWRMESRQFTSAVSAGRDRSEAVWRGAVWTVWGARSVLT